MGTKIEWAEESWNPVTGCTPISAGCKNCYAERMSKRLVGRFGYPANDPFRVTLHEDKLGQPLKWRKPRRVFVCSMGDLFHEDVQEDWLYSVWDTMRKAPQHTFLVLTKRPEWMRDVVSFWYDVIWEREPLPNVWLGVTVEDSDHIDRIDILSQVPAAVRFVSFEPLLDDVAARLNQDTPGIDWAIVGGETGPGARPMRPDWARGIREWALCRDVPFFFKRHSGRRGSRLLDGLEWNEHPEVTR